MEIADKIRYLRKEILGMDELSFAKLCDVNRRTIYAWENGESKPSLENIAVIATRCFTTIDYLIYDNCELQFCFPDISDEALDTLRRLIKNYEQLNMGKGE